MNITIIGTGYVGLVSGVCLAYKGHRVYCVDKNPSIIDNLQNKIPHIYEKGLEEILSSVIDNANFYPTTKLDDGLKNSELVIVAVGTPSSNGKIDLKYVESVISELAHYLIGSPKYLSVVIKSTVLPGTTDTYIYNLLKKSTGKNLGEFGLGMNPEFLREGSAVEDFLDSDRIIIGYEDEKTKKLLEEAYAKWNCKKIYVNSRTAEMIKYTNNSLLATLISLSNELSNVAFELGNIDFQDVIEGIKFDKRWSPILNNEIVHPEILSYLKPGPGFGGSCFPKDVQAILSCGNEVGLDMKILNAVLNVNEKQPERVTDILNIKMGSLRNKKILVLGLAFKPDTNDIRESRSLIIIKSLLKNECIVYAHDPVAIEATKKGKEYEQVIFVNDWNKLLNDVDAIIIATNWSEYKELTDYLIERGINDKLVIDTRRFLEPNNVLKNYFSLDFNKLNKYR